MLLKLRLLFFGSAIFWTVAVYIIVNGMYAGETTRIIRLTQVYALTAFFFLYLAMILSPLVANWSNFPLRKHLRKLRNLLGICALFFGLLHASLAFFGQLGGFEGIFFLSDKYLQAIILSDIALIFLFLAAGTSFEVVKKKLPLKYLLLIDKAIYFAGFLILIHALLLGTHFSDLSGFIPQITFSALALFLLLEAFRLDTKLQKKITYVPQFGLISTLVIAVSMAFYLYLLLPKEKNLPIGIHSQHVQLAKDAQQITSNVNSLKIPGMDGDKTKRYTTSFLHAESIKPNQNTQLEFKVYDASSGNRVKYFKNIYEKPVHMIVVDSSLTYFNHIHPEVTSEGFKIITQFPSPGEYHIYLDFQPLGAIEQQMAFVLTVGETTTHQKSQHEVDTSLTKKFGKYQVSMQYPTPLMASQLSVGEQLLTFAINDSAGTPVRTLKPYLGAFGHLVMIRKETYEYLHVHPAAIIQPKPEANGGPEVQFMPLGLYGPIKPGIYRVFAQFNPNNELFTSDFTIEVK